MSTEIGFELTPKAQRLLAALGNAPMWAPKDIARVMDKENEKTIGHIQQAYLSFPKSGPALAIGLRVQSNRLRSAVWKSEAVVSGNTIRSAIGDSVKYAAAHEFGVDKVVTVRPHARQRFKVESFAGIGKRRVKRRVRKADTFVGVGQRRMVLPARGMFQRGITDRSTNYSQRISAAVIAAMKLVVEE